MVENKIQEIYNIEPWGAEHKRSVDIVRYLVVHRNSMRPDAVSLAEWFRDEGYKWTKSKRMSYHFIIRKDGVVEHTVPLDVIVPGAKGYNRQGIQIGVCGDFRKDKPTSEQFSSLVHLLADLSSALPLTNIIPHREEGSDACPGKNLDVQFLRGEVARFRVDRGRNRLKVQGIKGA